ncbi:hypothetical protein FJT64_020612 [Amphibalanus amphitrite]|uniref:Uncharacterized protein n=1 Tax=Amphibalanus amphitrite TaxID=1232801 RepID=A0A6A4WMS7_AMPAM|nr:hypothetical protein FJT64_020612 [Amphibalanus amphitrite]
MVTASSESRAPLLEEALRTELPGYSQTITAMLLVTGCVLLLSAVLTSGGDPVEVTPFRPPPDELDRLLDTSLLSDIEDQLSLEAARRGSNSTALLSRSRRALAFPTGSYAQVDFQLYVPFYTQGDFSAILDWTTRFRLFLPNSTSGISLGRRSLDDDREKIYGIIEAMMYSFGVDGHVCLLRTICDVAEQPFQDDGVLGDVINTVMA